MKIDYHERIQIRNFSRNNFASIIYIFLLILPFLISEYFQKNDLKAVKTFKSDILNKPQIINAFGNIPMHFEANQGQTDEQVKFISHGLGYTCFLTSNGAVVSLKSSKVGDPKPDSESTIDSGFPLIQHPIIQDLKSTEVRLQLIGSNPESEIIGLDELPGKSNYFSGKNQVDWCTNINNFAKIKYLEVYRGIDLVYYGNQGELEYDFVVAPGADPNDIILELAGVENLSINDDGNLIMPISEGELFLKAPDIYQEIDGSRLPISGRYVFSNDNQVHFEIDAYDASQSLIIDPVLSYSTYLGGSDGEEGRGIHVDQAGHIYVMGITNSADFPTLNPFQADIRPQFEGKYNTFVSKIDPTGSTLLYSSYFVQPCSDFDVDIEGNVYLGGIATYDALPIANAFQSNFKGSFCGFVTKLNSDGSHLIYSTYLGGSGAEYVLNLTVDPVGSAYITGKTESGDFPTLNAFQNELNFNPNHWAGDIFVTKLNPTGSMVYSTYLGGDNDEIGPAIAVDDAGNAYVAGATLSDDFPVANAFQASPAGDYDLFITKLNASGSALVYSTYIGGSRQESGGGEGINIYNPFAIAVDAEGNAYVTGVTQSPDFPMMNAFQDASIFYDNPFILKLSADGSKLIYSTCLGGSWGISRTEAIAVDETGHAYVAGYTRSTDFPTVNALQDSLNINVIQEYNHPDMFITKFGPDGSYPLFSTYLGSLDRDMAKGIFVDSESNIFVTGLNRWEDFPLVNPLQSSRSGYQDAIILKIGAEKLLEEGKIGQEVRFAGQFNTIKEQNEVTFIRIVDEDSIKVGAEIVEVTEDTISVIVPEGLIGEIDQTKHVLTRKDVLKPPDSSGGSEIISVKITVKPPGQNPITKIYEFKLFYPLHLIYDEVVIGGPPIFTPRFPPFTQQILRQEQLNFPQDVQTFIFIGKSTEGTAGLRVMNTGLFPTPLRLQAIIIDPLGDTITPDPPMNVGLTNEGFQFPVSKDGLYMIVVSHREGFIFNPGPFQIHLSGNVGVPRKKVDGIPEHPRATRLDILFNHAAPRPQILLGQDSSTAQTGLFKFANPVEVNPYAIAVLIPPVPQGYRSGVNAIVRAPDPAPLGFLGAASDITTPTARTPAGLTNNVGPWLGRILDFTQIPDPASVEERNTFLGGTVCAIVGRKDLVTLSLPDLGVGSLIVDMGSGMEIVDGQGNDFKVYSVAGNYSVAVANSPFSSDFKTIPGIAEGVEEFDLSGTTLSSARYVWITASPEVTLDAVQALNYFTDAVRNGFPTSDVERTTITMRRNKAPESLFDPWLELIAPDGSLMDRKRSGFGDLTSAIRSDAALINKELIQIGYYRFLGRGYELTPDEESFGSFGVRLESGGDYDPVDIGVSEEDESSLLPQRQGNISKRRQRNSYVFKANPGQSINIVVNGTGTPARLNPVVELYDPEDFLIAANDDYPGRERNAALDIVQLPTTSFSSGLPLPLSYPSTYRIVVSAIDDAGQPTHFSEGIGFNRAVSGGDYELKVFTGNLIGGVTNPIVNQITPNSAIQGTIDLEVTLTGSQFSRNAGVSFAGTGITVKNVIINSAEQLTATIDIAAITQPGQYDVIVTNPDGRSGTGAGLFSVTPSIQTDVILTWDVPALGQDPAPPTNLRARISGNQMSGTMTQAIDRNLSLAIEELLDGVPVTKTIATGDIQSFFINVLTDVDIKTLTFKTSNTSGDPDLFVRFQSQPDIDNDYYDFSSENFAPTEEVITITKMTNPALQVGDWFVTVYAYEQTTYTLTAVFNQFNELSNGLSITRSIAEDELQEFFIAVPTDATTMRVETLNSTGDPDLYLRWGIPPDFDFDIFDFSSENLPPLEESIIVNQSSDPVLQAGDWFVTVFGWEQSTYSLTATHNGNGGNQLISYNIYRSTTANAKNTGVKVGNVNAGQTTFTDVISFLGTYFYQVTAIYAQGESEPSNEATALVTSIEEEQSASIPTEFSLSQNYPNPFNLETAIGYSVPELTHLLLEVYNVMGKKVATLVDERKSSGKYRIKWDGKDDSGNTVSAGVYVARLRAGGFNHSIRMLLLK